MTSQEKIRQETKNGNSQQQHKQAEAIRDHP